METLQGKLLTNVELKDSLIRIVDVVNFEGPLLTLFQKTANRHLYLADWVEKDATFNRWLVYRCNPIILDKFMKEQISHYDLFMSDELVCCKIDIDKNLNWHNPVELEKSKLPKNYIPSADVFFEEYDCPNFSKLEQFINQAKDAQKQENLVVI